MIRYLAVDPPYPEFLGDKFFDAQDSLLNRDDQLLPYRLLRDQLRPLGIEARTPDMIPSGNSSETAYISFGGEHRDWWSRAGVQRPVYVYMEAPSSIPNDYKRAQRVCNVFDNVLCFSRDSVYDYTSTCILPTVLREYTFPSLLPYDLSENTDIVSRQPRICVIAANKSAKFAYRGRSSLYEFRKGIIGRLANLDAIDLYGGNWHNSSIGYWRNLSVAPIRYGRAISTAHKGRSASKLATMRQYTFALCIETHRMINFVTEKPIDCLRAGCIPIYFGAPNVTDVLPKDCFIDLRDFRSLEELVQYCSAMSESSMRAMVTSGQSFLESPRAKRFTPEFFANELTHLISASRDSQHLVVK